jgi:hypothetical protein
MKKMNAPSASTQLANPFNVWFEPHAILEGKSLMDHLYNRLDGAYPHKWRSNFPSQQAIDNWAVSWAEAFEDEKITPNDVKAGLKACRTRYDWPPSCAEFIKACKPVVDPMVAYYEAVAGVQARKAGEAGKWSHPAIFWAAMSMSFDLGLQTFSQIKGRWEAALKEQMDKGEWAAIPAPMVALPAPGKADLSKEKAAKMLNQLGASDVLKPKSDHKLWAKRILEAAKKPGHRMTPLQVQFATEAMKNTAVA